MRFNYFLAALCLAGSTAAAPREIAKRDTQPLYACFTRISVALQAIDSGMKARPNGGTYVEAQQVTYNLMGLTQETINVVQSCAQDVQQRQGDVSASEGLMLMAPVISIYTDLLKVVDGWKNAKTMVVAAGQKDSVLSMLIQASESSIKLADEIIGKVPYLGQPVGALVKNTITQTIGQAIAEYRKR
jgi:hypothetical protein